MLINYLTLTSGGALHELGFVDVDFCALHDYMTGGHDWGTDLLTWALSTERYFSLYLQISKEGS